MKPYLVIVNDCYYPSSGTRDWRETYETLEEAENVADGIRLVKPDYSVYVVNLLDWINR